MNKIKLSTENLPLYYNKEYNSFQTLHSVNYDNQTAILSGCCAFLDDSFTTDVRHEVKLYYLSKLQKLNKRNIDKYQFIELYELIKNYTYYRIKKSLNNDTDLFYKNECVIKSFIN
jgi:hypothetical protein